MKKESGLTLIEILVVISVFAGMISIISGIFIANSRIQRRGIAVQKTLGEVSYATEYMTRSMRMAKSDDAGTCLSSGHEYYTYEVIDGGNGIQYVDYMDRCVNFFLDHDEGVIKRGIFDDGVWEDYYLTSGVLHIENLYFSTNVTPDSGTPDIFEEQPAVTFVIEVDEMDPDETEAGTGLWSTNVQASVTRRKLDIERDI